MVKQLTNMVSDCKSTDSNCKTISESSISKSKRIYNRRCDDRIKRWTAEECKLYEIFISANYELMNNTGHKRSSRVFLIMAQYIKTKNAAQCRSHHQKFYKRTLVKKENLEIMSETAPTNEEEFEMYEIPPENIYSLEDVPAFYFTSL